MKRILLATDGSNGADRAADVAATYARLADAEVVIITIGEDASLGEARSLAHIEGSLGDALELIHTSILHSAEERLRAAGVTRIKTEFAFGDPAEMILKAAKREAANAIFIGRRGRSRLAGLLLGSVSQKLATLAPCTVVIVP